jgi:hypothetical protein
MNAMIPMEKLSPGIKSWVTKERAKTFAEMPERIECPRCKQVRLKKKFGVRTFRDSTGVPVRFGAQSYCTPCRNSPSKKSMARKSVEKKMVAALNEIAF